MSRQQSINAQIKRAEDMLPKIEAEYNNSLHKQQIQEDLKLDIQTFCGHLRSALDYIAHDIVEKYCPNAKSGNRLYFPITDNNTSFKKRMTDSYPDLQTNCPDLYSFLESVQPYLKDENKWLSQFNEINNENKHNDLVEQKRIETKQLNISSGGATMSLGQGASISLGSGASIRIGGLTIPGGQIINTNNPARTFGDGKQEIITWVDFKFKDIDVSALWLLKESLKQIQIISSDLSAYL